MSRYMSRSGAMNLLPTQGPTFPSMHECPVVQLREEVNNDKIHLSKMAIAIAHAPITRPYLSFEETDDEFAYEEEDDDDYNSDSPEVVESGSEDESYYGKPPSRGGCSFPRQQFTSSAPQSSRHLPFNQQFKRNPKCEYCYMQSRGNGKSLDFHHNISNCPQMIAKFSNVNMAAVEDDPEDSDNEQEFAEFYDQSL